MTWESISSSDRTPRVSRFPVPGGWLYAVGLLHGETHVSFVPGTLGLPGSGVALHRRVKVAISTMNDKPAEVPWPALMMDLRTDPFSFALPASWSRPLDDARLPSGLLEHKQAILAWWKKCEKEAVCLGVLQDGKLVIAVDGLLCTMSADYVIDLESLPFSPIQVRMEP